MLESSVKVINTNLPVNHPILKQCRPLYEYSWFIQKIKDYIKQGKNRDEAIVQAMRDCEEEGILAEFLNEHGTEGVNMLFTEFNMEDALEVRFDEGVAKGREAGKAEALVCLVRKKLLKGLPAKQAADYLEADADEVSRIYEAIRQNPDKDDAEISKILWARDI